MRVKNCLRISRSRFSNRYRARSWFIRCPSTLAHLQKPLVAKGDHVLKGQIIAEAGGFISANVLSSVSGTVKGIESKLVANGAMVQSILVENDGEEEAIEGFGTDRDATKLSKEEIRKIVKDAGIVSLGGAGFRHM